MKKHAVQVRRYPEGLNHYHSKTFELVETVSRVLRAESIGNFNPIFCTYQGERTLVHSDAGDLSDPFRAEQSYLKTLFVEIN
jgi:hypothetical protein